ncbi:MAG: hypothetical protein HRT68_06770 [Flavobacteriaceae bacterium]|nr:hypothetical protein [Flavobacteriaceae bacterium]
MDEKRPYNFKQILFVFIKLAIVAGAFYFIYNKLVNNDKLDLQVLIQTVKYYDLLSIENILLLLLFSIGNWFFEILKWKTLVSFIKKISFSEAFQQSLGAHTASLFTPNKIGEFGAKAIYFAKQFRKRILLLTFLGNLVQLLITLVFGLIGLVFFIKFYSLEIPFEKVYKPIIGLLLIIGLFYFRNRENRFTIKGFSFKKMGDFIRSIPTHKRVEVIAYSVIRYLIFSHQFYFLAVLFQLPITYTEAMTGISCMYLISSAIPMLFFLDVVVKGSVAVWIFGFIGIDEILILSIITISWIFNFVLPNFIGSYFILNFEAYKQTNLET